MTSRHLSGIAGVVAFVTFNAGWIAGDLAQRDAFSPANDDISYLGASTARSAWLYNQLAANVSGVLLATLAAGLWIALRPSRLGRAGAAALFATGVGILLDGLFRLDCQSIDPGCVNDSWHAHAHTIESGFTVAFSFAALILLGLAFRRLPAWRPRWLPTIGAIPAVFAANIAFSVIGAGAATRAGTVVLFLTFAAIAWRLKTKAPGLAGASEVGGTGLEPVDARRDPACRCGSSPV